MSELIRPFGPSIMVDEVSDELVETLNQAGDRVLSDPQLSEHWDWSHMLAGNVDREVLVAFRDVEERARALAELRGKCLLYYELLRKHDSLRHRDWVPLTEGLTPENLEFQGMWLVSQRAGDFNPCHSHGGDFSSVLYLRLPPGLEDEWEKEDHHPSVGAIEFFDGRPNSYTRTSYRLRPRVGMIVLFPSWLPHTVYPFRSEGERRSMSFNVAIRLPQPGTEES